MFFNKKQPIYSLAYIKENCRNDLFMCFKALFCKPWVGCSVCPGKLESKMPHMYFGLKLDTCEHILEVVPGPGIQLLVLYSVFLLHGPEKQVDFGTLVLQIQSVVRLENKWYHEVYAPCS